jgi:Ulp1 family protease
LWLQQGASIGRNIQVTLYKSDRETLEYGMYINDNLIDFWMWWITRNESKSKSCVHIFSTHFYSTLVNDGVGGVSRWTTRKGLDIFIKTNFITVNLNSHWSIMAVFNAGMINTDLVEDESGDPYDLEVPALIHLNSLKLHDGAVVARNIRTWLIHEWDKNYSSTNSRLFNEQSMHLFKPKGKYLFLCYDTNATRDDY